MVLILSDNFDQSTNDVIDWLILKGATFLRINDTDVLDFKSMSMHDKDVSFILSLNELTINLTDVKSFWFRRGYLNFKTKYDVSGLPEMLAQKVKIHLTEEKNTLRHFVYRQLTSKNSIGNPIDDNINKLDCLMTAVRFGLKVPRSFILTSPADVVEALKSNNLVTKGIKGVACFNIDLEYIGNYTESVHEGDFFNHDTEMFPSLFQEKIEKEYELRIYYLRGEFYSMAIFSQLDSQTKIDFRRYNTLKPNRFVPYKLPNEIEIKLGNLMQFLNLSTGSIDMIYTKEKEYIFLEINPVGQFGMVSRPCNYNLEEKIADTLHNER